MPTLMTTRTPAPSRHVIRRFQMGFRGKTESVISMAREYTTPISRASISPYPYLDLASRLPPDPSPKRTRNIQTLAEATRKYQVLTPVFISRNTTAAPLLITPVLSSSLRQPTPLLTRPISAPGRKEGSVSAQTSFNTQPSYHNFLPLDILQ